MGPALHPTAKALTQPELSRMPRPLFTASITQLEIMLNAARTDRTQLLALDEELNHRSTSGATRLRIAVREALAGIGNEQLLPDSTILSRERFLNNASSPSVDPASPQALAAKLKIAELRAQLLDLSNRNRLLNFKHTVRGARKVRVVDESLVEIFRQLQGSGTVELVELPPLPEEPDMKN